MNDTCGYCGNDKHAIVSADDSGRKICDECEQEDFAAYTKGFFSALYELEDGVTSHHGAEIRGLFTGDPDAIARWDEGYARAILLWRLGFEVEDLKENTDSALCNSDAIIAQFLDGKWPLTTRPDPRSSNNSTTIGQPRADESCEPASPAEQRQPSVSAKENVYNAEIGPLVQHLYDICGRYNIPMLCAFEVSDDLAAPDGEGKRLFGVTMRLPRGASPRMMAAHSLIENGTTAFVVMSPSQNSAAPFAGGGAFMGLLGPVCHGSA
jgi:hypothetical protein